MGLIAQIFPGLSFVHLRELADVVVRERNAVATINAVYAHATWGLACLCCQAVKHRIAVLDKAGVHPWLRYMAESGMAYTVLVDEVPLRIQPDVEEIRDVMPGERSAMRVQTSLFDDGDVSVILRLEVAQQPGCPVGLLTLFLFDERTGVALDSEVIYTAAKATGAAVPGAGTVVSFARPAQDVETHGLFAFPANDDEMKADGDD